MSLQVQYRPKSLKTFIGNEAVVESLSAVLQRKNPPSAFLFTGMGGTGKTTIGRIVARMLKCKKTSFKELNSADDRGIDGIRKIINEMKYVPLDGGKKVMLLDEAHCFDRRTLVSTPNGRKRIDSLSIGDTVFNLNGTDIIEKVFINKVALDNITRINKSDGSHTFCSKDHEYYIDGEWTEAKDLTNRLLVKYSQHMTNISLQGNTKNEMRMVQQNNNKKQILLQKLFWKICQKLCEEYSYFRREKRENQKICFSTQTNRTRQKDGKKFFKKDEKKQSNEYARCERENDSDTTNKRNTSCLARKTWWQRTINRVTEIIDGCIRMGIGSCYKNSRSFAYATTTGMVSKEESSYQLQSRCREQEVKTCYRNRREESQFKSTKSSGQKERFSFKMERVESVEIYKQGSNDKSFTSVIGDKERNQGYVEFYDLQIKENHSYIANNNMVHNCLTKPSQEALLKALEEPPKHIHFIVCTTNPEMLKQTFKRRCHAYELEPLKNSDLQKLLKRVLRKEGRINAVSSEVRDKISELADGSAGQALKLLDQVIDMDNTERAISTLQSAGTSESEVIDICRTLCHYNMPEKTKWVKIKKILKTYNGDGESARRPIAGYLSAILLNNGGDDIAYMLENFTEKNFFDSGKAGLVLACYKSVFIGEN